MIVNKQLPAVCRDTTTNIIITVLIWLCVCMCYAACSFTTQQLRRQSTTPLYVEWIVVNDNRQVRKTILYMIILALFAYKFQYIANGRNLSATVLRALALANQVDDVSIQVNWCLTNDVL